jgi:phosphoglycerate dehydrogenase-like enzyme
LTAASLRSTLPIAMTRAHTRSFAFLHPVGAETLSAFRTARPEIEFLVPEGKGLPAGTERATGAAVGWGGPSLEAILAAAPRLEWLHQRGAGIDRIAGPLLEHSTLVLTNGSGNHAPNIAEHLLALILAFARGLPALLRAQHDARWETPEPHRVFEISGQTLAVVGLGAIGGELAPRAHALGMRVVGVRRGAVGTDMPRGVARVVAMDGLDAALGEADHVAICLPLTGETRGLFDAARLARVKHGAYLYNVGRGPIVDQTALLEALHGGRLAGVGLDVTDPEPLPAESPLWREPNVIVTAHSAGQTPRSAERYHALLLDNLDRWVRGETLRNVVDKRLGY